MEDGEAEKVKWDKMEVRVALSKIWVLEQSRAAGKNRKVVILSRLRIAHDLNSTIKLNYWET